MPTVSFATVLLSALVSVLTGYIGSLLSMSRQRRIERRVYGLALLAEIKAIQRGLMRYKTRIDHYSASGAGGAERLRHELSLWRRDLSVYANNSGRIGMFSVRTAIELIEFYHGVRWLDARIAELDDKAMLTSERFTQWIDDHYENIRRVRLHGRYLSRLLRREVPATLAEVVSAVRGGRLRRSGRRALRGKGHFGLAVRGRSAA